MSWGADIRRRARIEAKKRGHDLGKFQEGHTTWLATCRRCARVVEADGRRFRFLDDGRCPGKVVD